MIGPEVAFLGFACSGLKIRDGSLVHSQVRGASELGGDELVKGQTEGGEVFLPLAHEAAVEGDTVANLEFPFLSVVGLVVAKLFGEEVGGEAGGEVAFWKKTGLKRGGDELFVGVANAGVGGTNDALDGEGGGVDVEFFVDLFSDTAEEVGSLENLDRDDGALGAGKFCE